MMGVDGLWRVLGDQCLDGLDHFKERYRIEAIIRQLVQRDALAAEQLRHVARRHVQSLEFCGISVGAVSVARSDSFAQNRDVNIRAFAGQLGDGSSAAEDFIIRMRRHYQHIHFEPAWMRASALSISSRDTLPLINISRLRGPRLKSKSIADMLASNPA